MSGEPFNPYQWQPGSPSQPASPEPPPPPKRKTPRQGIAGVVVALGAAFLKYGFLLLKLFKLSTLFSGLLTYAFLVTFYGWQFALGIVLLVLVHEFGHMVAATHEGLSVTAPIFALMGAFVRTSSSGLNLRQDALVAIAGPAAGLLAAAACGLLAINTAPGRTQGLFFALTSFGCLITLFNMLPFHPMDGGKVALAVSGPWLAAGALIFLGLFLLSGNGMVVLFALVTGYVAFRKVRKQESYAVPSIATAYCVILSLAALGLVWADQAAFSHGLHF